MSAKVTVQGAKELAASIEALTDSMGRAAASGLVAAGKIVEGEAKKLIADKSSGKTYTKSRNSGTTYDHQASLPGDAPNTDTGRLIRSIQTEVKPMYVAVGTSLEYAYHLEFGTKNMKPRPFLTPAFEAKKKEAFALIGREVNHAISSIPKSTV